MKFEFITTTTVDTSAWNKSNKKLEQDLQEITTKAVSEKEIVAYLNDMVRALRTVKNDKCCNMLFLMYDEPSSMPGDARVEYVYKPTYIASAIMMTAMNRFDLVAKDSTFQKTVTMLLEASLGREFRGAGYDEYVGYLDALQIFATGDTLAFIEKYPTINERFVRELQKAICFLEDEICSGKIRDMWSGEPYSTRGKEVLAMYRRDDSAKPDYVWYACYGSNLCEERFMRYINSCSDTTAPREDRAFSFEHNIYFAKEAKGWQNGGKAFLDDSSSGHAYGRAYKITRRQFEEIMVKEGPDYTKKLYLGQIEGWPVYSFTDTQKNSPVRMPSKDYFATILKGLLECYRYGYDEAELMEYLVDAVFPANTFAVVRAIKESAHGVSNNQLCRMFRLDYESIVAAVRWLVEHNVIQQDRRSVCAGHQLDDPEAFFFTMDHPCARDLVSFVIERTMK